tara:strand:- start:534 stop:1115 length:582 start_codon:yes stop_codon:yes gene_type:complete
MKLPALLLMTLGLSLPAGAQTELRPADAARLNNFDTAAGKGLLQALSAGAPGDVAALATALSGTPLVAFDETLAGDWNCRTIKLGGITPLTVYSNFRCRMTLRLDGFEFEKLTGSQRTRGLITFREGRAVYVGVGHVADATPMDYADLPPDFRSDGRVQTDVAVFERISASHARLMFPSPANESHFDILDLTR